MNGSERYVARRETGEWCAGCFSTTDGTTELANAHEADHADHRVAVRAVGPGHR